MKKLNELKLTQLSRSEMKKVVGGTDTCTQRATNCYNQYGCSSYGNFATCIGIDIRGCSPLHEFELFCPNSGM